MNKIVVGLRPVFDDMAAKSNPVHEVLKYG